MYLAKAQFLKNFGLGVSLIQQNCLHRLRSAGMCQRGRQGPPDFQTLAHAWIGESHIFHEGITKISSLFVFCLFLVLTDSLLRQVDPSCMSEVMPITYFFAMTIVLVHKLQLCFHQNSSLDFVPCKGISSTGPDQESNADQGHLHALIVGAFNHSAINTRLFVCYET